MELEDHAWYTERFFRGTGGEGSVTGTLVPKGETPHELGTERTLLVGGTSYYVDPSTLVRVPDQTEPDTVRAKVLREAERLVTGDRNKTYGSPTQNFQDTAKIWTVQLGHKLQPGAEIDAGEVAALIIGLKLARIKASPKLDNWVDIAGYAACGAESDTETGKLDTEPGT